MPACARLYAITHDMAFSLFSAASSQNTVFSSSYVFFSFLGPPRVFADAFRFSQLLRHAVMSFAEEFSAFQPVSQIHCHFSISFSPADTFQSCRLSAFSSFHYFRLLFIADTD